MLYISVFAVFLLGKHSGKQNKTTLLELRGNVPRTLLEQNISSIAKNCSVSAIIVSLHV